MNQLDIHNPATGALITRVDADDAASVAEKALRARAAQTAWAAVPQSDRMACIQRFSQAVQAELEPLAAILTQETGKPIRMSRNELNGLIGRIDFFLKEFEGSTRTETVFAEGGMTEQIQHTPLGVVANISAWNYPWFVGGNVFVPALLTGNTVLYKPSEYATLTGLAMGRLLHAAGVPEDAFIVLLGGAEVGAALQAQHIDGLFFTGSYNTGARIAQALGPRMVKLQLELGGKDPTYVCEDADPVAAAESLADGAMYNTGQSCCSVERIYVHEKIHDAFVAAFLKTVAGFKLGRSGVRRYLYWRHHPRPATRCAGGPGERRCGQGSHLALRRQAAGGPGQLVCPHGAHGRGPYDGDHAGGELWPGHRHPESERGCPGCRTHERHPLWPDGRRLHAR
jgi:acyl-CoA reductase-like NAD-dependent aldehyde dehydrogenase